MSVSPKPAPKFNATPETAAKSVPVSDRIEHAAVNLLVVGRFALMGTVIDALSGGATLGAGTVIGTFIGTHVARNMTSD